MPVLGIDQSANHSGVTLLDDTGELILTQLIEPKKLRDAERLAYIRDALTGVLSHNPNVHTAVLEGYSYGSVNKKFVLGEVGGIVKVTLFDHKIKFYGAAPIQLKKFASGNAKATKQQVIAAVERKWGHRFEDDNIADSYALARLALELYNTTSTVRHELDVVFALSGKPKKARKPKSKTKKTKLDTI